jgi:hypothetical protein
MLRRAMMDAVSTSETSVKFYQTTRRNIPEDRIFRYFSLFHHYVQTGSVSHPFFYPMGT